jgi:hypothetical protein
MREFSLLQVMLLKGINTFLGVPLYSLLGQKLQVS